MAPYIAVIGAGECSPEEARLAYAVGRELARRRAVLVCGGLGGIMAAASQGAAEAGGTVVGLLPGFRREEGNPYLSVAIATGLGEARNVLVVRAGDAVIAVGGGYGTLSEIGLALKLGRPVIGLGTWEVFRQGRRDPGIITARDPEEAVELAWRSLKASGPAQRRQEKSL
ncbi:MAG: TIGR00725 family protein [Moorellales bacterium]